MQLQELVNITNQLFYEDTSSYRVIVSKQNELLEIMNPECDIKSINYERINSYIQTLKNKNNSNNTINAKAAYLSKLLKYAYDNRLIDYKPPIPFYKIKKHKTLYLTKADMIQMALWARKHHQKDLQRIILIGYYTGLRINNILSVSKNNVEGDLLYIYDKKTNSEFYQPIHHKIKNIVFNLEGFDFNYNHIYYLFNIMKKDLKMDKQITIHTLRHTFCSTLNEKGVPVTVIRELANHRNIQTTMNYTHTKKEQCRQALNVL